MLDEVGAQHRSQQQQCVLVQSLSAQHLWQDRFDVGTVAAGQREQHLIGLLPQLRFAELTGEDRCRGPSVVLGMGNQHRAAQIEVASFGGSEGVALEASLGEADIQRPGHGLLQLGRWGRVMRLLGAGGQQQHCRSRQAERSRVGG